MNTLKELGGFKSLKKGQNYKFKDGHNFDILNINIVSDIFTNKAGFLSITTRVSYKGGDAEEITWTEASVEFFQNEIILVENFSDPKLKQARCFCHSYKIIPLFVSFIKVCDSCDKDHGYATKEEYYNYLKTKKE